MNQDDTDASHENNQRINHACQLCRNRRVRCSGHRPRCQRCQQQNVECVYGFARGDGRKSLLAALDEHNAHSDKATPRPDSIQLNQSGTMRPTVATGRHLSIDDDDDASDGTVDTESSLQSPMHSRQGDSQPEVSATKKNGRRQHRRTRISSACSECKKRRRKCTGENPCQTCKALQVECLYDRSQDRRSKAYFQKKLNEGVREAMESDNIGGVLKLIQRNDHYEQVASELRTALKIAEKSKLATSSDNSPITPEQQSRIVCKHFCGLSGPSNALSLWVPLEAQQRQEALLGGPQHHILPYVVLDDSPLSLAFLNFRDAVKHMLKQGIALPDILGPLDTEVDLLFRARIPDDHFTASTWACELARIYAHIDFFTQLANAFLLSRYMRWVLDPSLENYILLPDIMKPTKAQRLVPHFASADLYSIPEIRDSLIRGEFKLGQSIKHGNQAEVGLKFNWPFELDEAVDRNPRTGTSKISRLLAACASDPKYWSCSQDFLENFPETQGHLNVVTHQHSWDQLMLL